MKKIIILLTISTLLISFKIPSNSYFNIVGKWKTTNDKNIKSIEFNADGTASFRMTGMTYGGEQIVELGSNGSISFIIDSSEIPIKIDFIKRNFETGETSNFLIGIIERIEKNVIKIQLEHQVKRPSGFNDNEVIILER